MNISFASLVQTRTSRTPVRLSGVFVDSAGSVKGLAVLGVLPGVSPAQGWPLNADVLPQKVLNEDGGEIGTLDPFWWQSPEVAEADVEGLTTLNGGALTCTFTLSRHTSYRDERWLKSQVKIAAPESFIEKPVRLASNGDIGVIENEHNNIELGGRTVYPLLRLRRMLADRSANAGIRNGAMVFAQDGGMVGVIVAAFHQGDYYSVAPIDDVLGWHALGFVRDAVPVEPQDGAEQPYNGGVPRAIRGSAEYLKLLGG